MTTDSINKIPSYGQFFNCQTQLFGRLNYDRIFAYLFNEHLRLERIKKPTSFHVSYSAISNCCKVGRQTVYDTLQFLDEIGVISLDNSICNVDKDYFFSVVVLFDASDSETKKKIAKSFINGDKKGLVELGLQPLSLETNLLAGSLMPSSEQSVLYKTKCSMQNKVSCTGQSALHKTNCPVQDKVFSSEQNVLDKTNCPVQDSIPYEFIEKMTEMCSRWNSIAPIKTYFKSQEAFVDKFFGCSCTKNDVVLLQELTKNGYEVDENEINWDLMAVFMRIGMETVINTCLEEDSEVSCTRQSGVLYKTVGCLVQDTVINNNKEEKGNEQANEVSLLYKGENKEEYFEEGQKDYLGVFGKVNSDLIFQSQSEKDEEEDNEDFNRSEKASERNKRSKAFREYINPCRNKPYYKEEELSDFLENYEDCTSSPVKFWLWLVFDEMIAYYSSIKYPDDADETDEYGEATDEGTPDIFIKELEGFRIDQNTLAGYMDKFYKDIHKAYQDGKYVFTSGDKVELPKIEVKDFYDQLPFIFDWKEVIDEFGKKCMIVSLNKVRDIEASNISQIDTSMSKESVRTRNRQNRAYTKAIREADNSQLSNMEKAMRSFAETFVLFNEDGDIYWTTDGMGNRSNDISIPGQETPDKMVAWRFIQPWLHTLREIGVAKEDFFDMLNTKNTYKEGTTIDLRFVNGLFSYQKSKQWHETNQIEDGVWQDIASE